MPPEPELSSGCSMYYWCGWSRFTVNTQLRDFQSQNCVTLHPGGVRQHRARHHNLAHCSLLEATGCHASSCSMHHHASASCIMSHARNPGFFACVCCFGILIRSVIVNPTRLRSLFGPPKPLQRTAYQEISNQMGTYFVYLDISNTAGNPVRGIGTLDREIRCRSVQIMHE